MRAWETRAADRLLDSAGLRVDPGRKNHLGQGRPRLAGLLRGGKAPPLQQELLIVFIDDPARQHGGVLSAAGEVGTWVERRGPRRTIIGHRCWNERAGAGVPELKGAAIDVPHLLMEGRGDIAPDGDV